MAKGEDSVSEGNIHLAKGIAHFAKGAAAFTKGTGPLVINIRWVKPGEKEDGAHFNRFGIITTHIDGNGQTVFFEDLTYTVGFVPEPGGCAVAVVLMLVGLSRRRIRGGAPR